MQRRTGAEGSMVGFHNLVGTLVVIAFLALTVVNVVRVTGRDLPWARGLSFAAAALLLLQYLIGFALLGQDHPIPATHYVIALLAIITVGLEHGYARTRATPRAQALGALVATAATTALVVIAYTIGSSN
jgi:hypothetical protein